MQDGHSLANEVSLEKLFQYADTHSYHQVSVGGTTSFTSSFYSDFAFITLSKQISHNLKSHTGANTYSAITVVCPLLTEYDGVALRRPSLSLQWAASCRSYWAMLNPFLIFPVVSKHWWWVTNSKNSTLSAEPWKTSLEQEETLTRTSHTVYTISVPLLLATTRVHHCFKGWVSVSMIHMCVPVLWVNKSYV